MLILFLHSIVCDSTQTIIHDAKIWDLTPYYQSISSVVAKNPSNFRSVLGSYLSGADINDVLQKVSYIDDYKVLFHKFQISIATYDEKIRPAFHSTFYVHIVYRDATDDYQLTYGYAKASCKITSYYEKVETKTILWILPTKKETTFSFKPLTSDQLEAIDNRLYTMINNYIEKFKLEG